MKSAKMDKTSVTKIWLIKQPSNHVPRSESLTQATKKGPIVQLEEQPIGSPYPDLESSFLDHIKSNFEGVGQALQNVKNLQKAKRH